MKGERLGAAVLRARVTVLEAAIVRTTIKMDSMIVFLITRTKNEVLDDEHEIPT